MKTMVMAVCLAAAGMMPMPLAADAARQEAAGVSAADAKAFIGEWTIVSKGDYGENHFALSVKADGEKTTLDISSDTMPVRTITNLSKRDASLVVPYEITYEGNQVPVVLTLTPAGEGLEAAFDYASGAYTESGKGTRKAAGNRP